MMREQLTIVTAFFDIGRADWEKGLSIPHYWSQSIS